MSFPMRRALCGPTLLLAIVIMSQAAADDPAREVVQRLRDRGQFEAAVAYLEGLRTKADIDAETKALIPFELGSLLWQWSGTIKNEQERLDVLDFAAKHLREFLKEHPAHVQASEARLLAGQVGIERGKALGQRGTAAGEAEKRRKAIAQAEDEFKAARATLAALLKEFEAELAKFPAFLPAGAERRAKNEARRNVIETSFHLANASYQQAQLLERGSKSRAELLTEAAGVFHKVYEQFRTVFAGLYAAVWEARCHQEAGALKEALAIYLELLDVESTDENIRDLQTKSLRLAMECWSDPQQKQWQQIVDRGQAWLKATGAEEQEKADGWAIVFSLAKAQHAILEADKMSDPAGKARKLTAEARRAMIESTIGHARRVAESKSELAKEAEKLLRSYHAQK